MNYKYIFVLSMPRSGSTLFRMLLGKIDGCVSLPETFFFVFQKNNAHIKFNTKEGRLAVIENWIKYYTTRRNINDLDMLKSTLTEKAMSFKDILDLTVEQYISENNISNVKYIIEKSPPHIFFQPEIKQQFLNSRIIYLLRDPRSVAASMLNKAWATHNIYGIARSWRKSTESMMNSSSSIIIRYEDLVEKNENTFQTIKKFFGAEISSESFYDKSASVDFKGVNKEYHTNLNAPIDSKHIDKWKNQLSIIDNESTLIEHVCKVQMLKHNYKLEHKSKPSFFNVRLMLDKFKFLLTKFS